MVMAYEYSYMTDTAPGCLGVQNRIVGVVMGLRNEPIVKDIYWTEKTDSEMRQAWSTSAVAAARSCKTSWAMR